jgi:hypothetical protein
MPALTDIDNRLNSDPPWRMTYDLNFPMAQTISSRIPLIHVCGHFVSFETLISIPPHELPLSDSGSGYCSKETHKAEKGLGLPPSLYFYAGKAHPSFGSLALAFDPTCESNHSGSVTPFDTGGLYAKLIKWNLPDYAIPTLAKFMKGSIIDLKQWREEFAVYLAAYFEPVANYWQRRPIRMDPEELFQIANEWRAWVFEVRFHEAQRILDAVAWCASPEQVTILFDEIEAMPPLGSTSSALAKFLTNVESLAPAGTPHYCEEIEQWAMRRVGL